MSGPTPTPSRGLVASELDAKAPRERAAAVRALRAEADARYRAAAAGRSWFARVRLWLRLRGELRRAVAALDPRSDPYRQFGTSCAGCPTPCDELVQLAPPSSGDGRDASA